MGVSKNRGTPKWMVYDGIPYQNGWFGGTPIFKNIHFHTVFNQKGLWNSASFGQAIEFNKAEKMNVPWP